MQYLALELVFQTWDLRPFEIIQDARAMKQEMTVIFELLWLLAWAGLSQFDSPLSFLIVPVAADHLSSESHVLPEIKGFADFVKVLPDVGTVTEKARPVRVQCELVSVGM